MTVVAAPEVKPPAELLRCAQRPRGLPAAVLGTLTPEARSGLIRLMTAFGANADQLDRLTTFHTGQPCPTAGD